MTGELRSTYFHSGEEYQIVLLDYQKEKGENVDNSRSMTNTLTLWVLKNFRVSLVKQSNNG